MSKIFKNEVDYINELSRIGSLIENQAYGIRRLADTQLEANELNKKIH